MNVFCTRRIAREGVILMEQAGHHITAWEEERLPDNDELIQDCLRQDALIVADRNRIDAAFLQACKHLKVIALHSVGYNNVDIEKAAQLHIPVGHTPDAGSKEVADTAFMLMIAVSKDAFYMHQKIRKGEWGHFEPTGHLGTNLRGKTLGIFGLGNIGLEMARLSQAAYGMNIIYHNRHRNLRAETMLNARMVSFDDLLAHSDVLSVHAALTPETKGLFDAKTLSRMKPSAIFINTARGGIHDETALTEALQKGRLGGVGLDVTRPEPMSPDHPMLSMPHVVVTPHIGNAVDTARTKMAVMVAENIIAAGKGLPLPYSVPGAKF